MSEKKSKENKEIINALKDDKVVIQVYIPLSLMDKISLTDCNNKNRKFLKSENKNSDEIIELIRTQIKNDIYEILNELKHSDRELKTLYLETQTNLNLIFSLLAVFGTLILLFSILTFIFLLLK